MDVFESEWTDNKRRYLYLDTPIHIAQLGGGEENQVIDPDEEAKFVHDNLSLDISLETVREILDFYINEIVIKDLSPDPLDQIKKFTEKFGLNCRDVTKFWSIHFNFLISKRLVFKENRKDPITEPVDEDAFAKFCKSDDDEDSNDEMTESTESTESEG